MEKRKDKRGGARQGAGRPKGDSRMISFRAPGALADSLDLMDNRTEFIKNSLMKAIQAGRLNDCDPNVVQSSAVVSGDLEITRNSGVVSDDMKASRDSSVVPGDPNVVQSSAVVSGDPNVVQSSAVVPDDLEITRNSGVVSGSRAVTPVDAVPATRIAPLSLPYFDIRVVAGFPVPLDNDEKSKDVNILSMLCPHPEASYLIRVNGDSMIDAGVMSGDIVIVDKSNRNPAPKEIAVCELNGEYTLKHFVVEDGQGWLVPANPDFPRFKVEPDDEFSVWGTVTYIIHKARD